MITDRARIDAALAPVVDYLITDQCCSSCSSAAVSNGTYAYYHAQDIERAFKRRMLVAPLYIGFGIAEEGAAEPRPDDDYDAIGRGLVAALGRAGFGTEWSGSSAQRIKVTSVSTVRVLA